MKYKPGDIVRRTDSYLDKKHPDRVAHYLVLDISKEYVQLGPEYKVLHLERNEFLELFLRNSTDLKHQKVA